MAVNVPFVREYSFEYAVMETLTPLIRRITARNPGPYTFHGTGTYIIGRGRVAVVDPGPDLPEHVRALLAGLAGEEISHLVVTHTHRDHSPACGALQRHCSAPTYAFGRHRRARGVHETEVEEGADLSFVPDVNVRDGEVIEGDGWTLECVHTPGHTSNHVCYQLREERALFTGDHVMGWSTSIIAPPDGDMGRYLSSLRRLLGREDARYWPTHGPAIEHPRKHVGAFLAHRKEREVQILGCLRSGTSRIADMVPLIYLGLPSPMYPAAAQQILSTVLYLIGEGQIECEDSPSIDARYRLSD